MGMGNDSNSTMPISPDDTVINGDDSSSSISGAVDGGTSPTSLQHASTASSAEASDGDGDGTSESSMAMESTTTVSGINDNENIYGSSNSALRHQVGRHLSNVSDLINDNIIVVRYATISTVFLLGVYGGK